MKQLTILPTAFLSILMAFNTRAAQRLELNESNQYYAQPRIQDTLPLNPLDSLALISDSIAADRYNKNKSNMTILAAWAGVNIIQGSISATNVTGSGEHFLK